MNTLRIEALLADKYGYLPLPPDLSAKCRQFFKDNTPEFLRFEGDSKGLYTKSGSLICNQYDRIVVGDYGAFIEFSEENIGNEFIIQPGQEYRVNDKKYSKNKISAKANKCLLLISNLKDIFKYVIDI